MTAIATAVAVGADMAFGEPPARWHPVVWFGNAMTRVEARTYRKWRNDRRTARVAGVVHLAVGVGAAVAAGTIVRKLLGRNASTVLAASVCMAGRMLDAEARAVATLLDQHDLPAARQRLRSLAGRRADDLDEGEIARAVIESVAENSVDAVVSSMVAAAVGGAAAVLGHRAVNTLDAMVGHRNERYEHFGWACARFDDAVNFLPARIAALSVAACRPSRAGAVWRTVRSDARKHPSPNGGVIEAAYAAALGVRLGGVNRYGTVVEDRGTLGDGRLPVVADIGAAVRLRRQSSALLAVALFAIGLVGRCVRR